MPTSTVERSMQQFERRRLRRPSPRQMHGPRCPDCAGPLVFGEGCHVCPVCGYSACDSGVMARR